MREVDFRAANAIRIAHNDNNYWRDLLRLMDDHEDVMASVADILGVDVEGLECAAAELWLMRHEPRAPSKGFGNGDALEVALHDAVEQLEFQGGKAFMREEIRHG